MSPHDAYRFLRDRMAENFSLAGLRALCEDVGVLPDHLPHATTPELARGLLQWAAPHPDHRAALIARLCALRPHVSWPDDYALPPGAGPSDTPPYAPPPPPPLEPDGLPPLVAPGSLPPGHRIPFSRNPLFTGREEELRGLAAQLLPAAAGQPGSGGAGEQRHAPLPASVVTSGIGGVGKTQLAVEFAHRYGRFFHGVHWVSLADPAAVAGEVAACGAAMGLAGGFGALPLPDQTRLTQAAWAGPEPRLLIFDNCEDPALLAEWRPKTGGARLLITSRRERWPRGVAVRPLGTLPREEAVALLREHVDAEPAAGALADIAAELGDLPLALHLAGSYLAYLLEMLGGRPRHPRHRPVDPAARPGAAAPPDPAGRGNRPLAHGPRPGRRPRVRPQLRPAARRPGRDGGDGRGAAGAGGLPGSRRAVSRLVAGGGAAPARRPAVPRAGA